MNGEPNCTNVSGVEWTRLYSVATYLKGLGHAILGNFV